MRRSQFESSTSNFGRTIAGIAIALLLLSATVFAQFDTGTITGLVTDQSGAVVAGSTVTVTNTGTGVQTTYKTDSSGNFVASALPFGNYTISAKAAGFAEARTQSLALSVGGNVKVKLALAVAITEQTIEVTGTTTTVDTTSSTAGSTLSSDQIANLPINGRDVSNFLNVAPGSVNSTGYFQGSVNGLENIFTGLNITVDGQSATRGDINGFLQTEGQEAARITRASVESIQEINFSNSGYTAETGHSLGPQMNIITKSGTNALHGTVFEYLRNEALDAHDYFAKEQKDPLRLNQFGGNLAGPIVRNKLFFFANYEGDRTRMTSLNPLYKTLSAYARSQLVPSLKPLLNALPALPQGCTAIPAPASCAVPTSLENNNAATQGANLVYMFAALPTTLREDTGSLRMDYVISDKDRIMGRYNINDSITQHAYGLNAGQVSPQSLRTQLAKIEQTHTFSPTLLNQFGVSVTRFFSTTNSNTGGDPLVTFQGFFTDLGALPGANTFNQNNANTIFEVTDGVTKIAGKHSLSFGAQIRASRLNTWLRPQQVYSYYDFANSLFKNDPFALQQIGYQGYLGLRNSNWDFYVQDNWRATERLTLNIGLRYDYNTAWSEVQNRQQNFDFNTQKFLPRTQAAYNAPKNDFAPRVGFSYDVLGNGKTAIHGYAGMFYMPMNFSFGLATNIPEQMSYNVNLFDALLGGYYPLSYPAAKPPFPLQNVTIFPQNPKDPYSTNWLFGVEHELRHGTILTVNYTGNKTTHMQAGIAFAAIERNPLNSVLGTRPFSGFASESYAGDVLSSKYNALQVQLRHKAGRLNLETNYTWAHETDDLVNVFSSYSNPFDPKADYSSGDIDTRHNLTASMVYSLPELKGQNGFLRGVFGGWEASSILQTRSGLPVNVTLISGFFGNPMRPNLVPGQSLWLPNASWPNQSYNAAAFVAPSNYDGSWGNNPNAIGRNLLRGPGFFQWDFSGMKNFTVTEKVKLQFRADLFNILNHPNFTSPDGGICTAVGVGGTCTPNLSFGKVSQTIASASGGAIGNGTARQAQFSLKLMF